jgi:hypothetical protein
MNGMELVAKGPYGGGAGMFGRADCPTFSNVPHQRPDRMIPTGRAKCQLFNAFRQDSMI